MNDITISCWNCGLKADFHIKDDYPAIFSDYSGVATRKCLNCGAMMSVNLSGNHSDESRNRDRERNREEYAEQMVHMP